MGGHKVLRSRGPSPVLRLLREVPALGLSLLHLLAVTADSRRSGDLAPVLLSPTGTRTVCHPAGARWASQAQPPAPSSCRVSRVASRADVAVPRPARGACGMWHEGREESAEGNLPGRPPGPARPGWLRPAARSPCPARMAFPPG